MSEQSEPSVPPGRPTECVPAGEVPPGPPGHVKVAGTRAATVCLVLGVTTTLLLLLLFAFMEIDPREGGMFNMPSERSMVAFAGFVAFGWPLLVIATGITGVIGLRSRRGVIRSIIGMILSWIPALVPLAMLLSR